MAQEASEVRERVSEELTICPLLQAPAEFIIFGSGGLQNVFHRVGLFG